MVDYAVGGGVFDGAGNPVVGLRAEIDSGNSTTANLGIGGVFTGTAKDVLGYVEVRVTVHADVASATDGLELQWSDDQAEWDTSDEYTYAPGSYKIFSVQVHARYYRIRYTNGSVGQSSFHLTSQLSSVASKPSSHRLQDNVTTEDDATLNKSVIAAARATGIYQNVRMDSTGSLNVAYGDSANLDAFSRLRVSGPDTIFDSNFQYDLQPLVFYTQTANGGTVTHDANNASATLALDGTANGEATIQSKAYHRYIPGKSQLCIMTSVFGAAVADVKRRAGYFDDDDGVFLEQNGTTDIAMVIRSSTSGVPVETRVTQANWNIDTLDGSGDSDNRSNLTLDLSKAQILVIEMQWLGMGRVRVGFDIDGRIYMVHEFKNANSLSTVYMKTANLPVRWQTLGDTASSMFATCSSVQSEGGADAHLGYNFSYERASVTAGNGTQTYAFSIRPKATFNSITNRMLLRLLQFFCLVTGNSSVLCEVYYDTTVGGTPAWADMDATYSALQVDTAGTPSGGVKAHSFFIPATAANEGATEQDFSARYPLVLDIPGTGFTNLTVYVTGQGGTSACRPGLRWEEVR